eukprot:91208-Chlamydomonas_euryale.AAC.1
MVTAPSKRCARWGIRVTGVASTPCCAVPCRAHAMPCHTMPYHAMPCHAMQFVSCNAMPRNTVQCQGVQFIPCNPIPLNTQPYNAKRCHGRAGGHTDGRADGWTDGRADGQTEGWVLPHAVRGSCMHACVLMRGTPPPSMLRSEDELQVPGAAAAAVAATVAPGPAGSLGDAATAAASVAPPGALGSKRLREDGDLPAIDAKRTLSEANEDELSVQLSCPMCASLHAAGRQRVVEGITALENPAAMKLGCMILAASPRIDALWDGRCTPAHVLEWVTKADVPIKDMIHVLRVVSLALRGGAVVVGPGWRG